MIIWSCVPRLILLPYNILCLIRHREAGDGDRLMLWEMGLAGMFSGLANSPQRQVIERVKSVMQVSPNHSRTNCPQLLLWLPASSRAVTDSTLVCTG